MRTTIELEMAVLGKGEGQSLLDNCGGSPRFYITTFTRLTRRFRLGSVWILKRYKLEKNMAESACQKTQNSKIMAGQLPGTPKLSLASYSSAVTLAILSQGPAGTQGRSL